MTLESTPLPPPPRRVRHSPGGWGGIWFGRLFTLPHTLIGIGAFGYLILLVLWRVFGADLPGEVTSSKISHSSKGGTSYILQYRYQVGVQWKSGSGTVSRDVYERFQSRDDNDPRIAVHYFSLGPFEHAAVGESGSLWSEVGFLSLWAGFWNFVVLIAVYELWIKPLRRRQLYKRGISTSGTIVGKRVKTGRSSSYYLSYSFRAPETGELIRAEMLVWNVDAWKLAREGQPVTILVAPNNSKRSTVYEFGGYRVQLEETSMQERWG